MKTGWWILFGMGCAFLLAGLVYLAASPPRGEPVILREAPPPAPIIVHVVGAVRQPGVYTLPAGSRVRDALEAAGGASAAADEGKLNLAAFLEDGEQLRVPQQVSAEDPLNPGPGEQAVAAERGPLEISIEININTASADELASLPGIGPVIAAEVVAYREEHGPFAEIEEIQNVSGIGPATFEKIRDLIEVE